MKKQELIKTCQNLLKSKELDDIIIIGSFVKGKQNPKDIDLCFVFNSYNDKIIEGAYKKFKVKVHITKTKFNHILEDPALWKTIIHEGFSIKKMKNVSDILSIKPYLLFEYELKNLNNIQKQTFSHALYGTGGRENFLKKNKGSKIGKSSIIVPLEYSEEIRAFLETWKVVYKVRRVWL